MPAETSLDGLTFNASTEDVVVEPPLDSTSTKSALPVGDGGPDADADAGLDGNTVSDGGGDAEGGDAGFCAMASPGLRVCEDFDKGTLPVSLAIEEKGSATARIVDGGALSGVFALLCIAPPTGGLPTQHGATISHALSGDQAKLTIDFDVRVEQLGATIPYDILTIRRTGAEFGGEVNPDGSLVFDEDVAAVGDAALISTKTPLSIVLTNAWAHVKLVTSVRGSSANAQLFVDGALVGTTSFSPAPMKGSPRVRICDDANAPISKEWRVRVDNITIDLR